jgi:uncharacterized protein (TIGR02246 family)
VATERASDEGDIRQRIEKAVSAVRARDIEGVMTLYAPDIVSFDIAPPLQHIGAEAKRKAWMEAFAAYQPPIGYEIRDLTITLGDAIAFAHSINRITGTLNNGTATDFWLRWTTCFRKIKGTWFLAHEQVSVPIDLATGSALLNLEP